MNVVFVQTPYGDHVLHRTTNQTLAYWLADREQESGHWGDQYVMTRWENDE